MTTIKDYHTFLNESLIYDPNREYSYDFVVGRLRRGPGYIKKLISKLPKIDRTKENGEPIIMTRISEQIFRYLFDSRY